MRRLPILPIVGVFLILAALPAVSQTRTVEGTWLLTQKLDIGLVPGTGGAGAPLVYELLHLDADTEVREQSSLFQSGPCGHEIYAAFGVTIRLPFSASAGIGHWTLADDVVKVSSYHLLYDCLGNALGVAWSVREAKAVYAPAPAGAGGEAAAREVIAWEGASSIEFFKLSGDPLPLPIFLMPVLPGSDLGISRLSGSFRAQRAFGEPAR
jgi:hypothetical protein